jgi:multiple sugar transport system permease protein
MTNPMNGAPPTTPPARQKRLKSETREAIWGYIFISPWIIGFLLFSAGPILATFYFSLTSYNVVQPPVWVGLDNYVKLFIGDPAFQKSLGVTLEYTLARVPLVIAVGIGLAILVNKPSRLMNVFRLIFYFPAIIPLVAASIVWLWMLSPQFGFINPFFRDSFGIVLPNWLKNQSWALYAVILLSIWQVGQTMMIFLAGLQEIPQELYEAADIDGASTWRKFRSITLPMLTPTIYFNCIIIFISSFQVFAAVFVLTNGGPANRTMVYVMYLYRRGIEFLQMGYASAMAIILVLIVLALTILIMTTSNKWVNYDRT